MRKDQIEQLRYLSRKLIRELGLLQLDHSNADITPAHWHTLIEIDKDPGITILKLGHLLLMSASKISRLIKVLNKDKLIELKVGADKREKYLYLTATGKKEIEKIDKFSVSKIENAFRLLNNAEMLNIIESIDKYSDALEKSRLAKEQIKIAVLPTSRTIRKQIANMITEIQKHEFSLPVTSEINQCVINAEPDFYYHHSYNFWYGIDHNGKVIGSIGLKKLDNKTGEIKKFFVVSEYRGQGVSKKLMDTLLDAAKKHGFKAVFLGTVDKLHAAHKFYEKYGFKRIPRTALPDNFIVGQLDSIFFQHNLR
jgi:N-acetylglutamate synthase-like GNAT family acetyltransferase/DNA-binding MarR family transcriptional regulator